MYDDDDSGDLDVEQLRDAVRCFLAETGASWEWAGWERLADAKRRAADTRRTPANASQKVLAIRRQAERDHKILTKIALPGPGAGGDDPEATPRARFLGKCLELNIPPEPMGIIQKQPIAGALLLQHWSMGNDLAEALSRRLSNDFVRYQRSG